MSLGYALLHTGRIDAALEAHPQRLGFDDGGDIIMAAFGADFSSVPGNLLDGLTRELDHIAGELGGIVGLDGPLGAIPRFIDDFARNADLVGAVEKIADFLCALDPETLRLHLQSVIDQLGRAAPLLLDFNLIDGLAPLIDSAFAFLEGRFLGGQDDEHAHRGYRAAALLRSLLGDVLTSLEASLATFRPTVLLGRVADLLPTINRPALEFLSGIGQWLKDNVLPIARPLARLTASLSVSVSVGGPSSMPDAVTFRDDSQVVPFPVGDPYWFIDLFSGALAVLLNVFEIERSRCERWADILFIDVLGLGYQSLKVVLRACRPDFLKEANAGTFWFTDWGEFVLMLVLHFITALIHDSVAWSNFLASMGQRICKYFVFTLQPRMVYLFFRSYWFADSWKTNHGADDKIPLVRLIWLQWPQVAVLGLIAGMIMGLVDDGWQNFDLKKVGLVLGVSLPVGIVGAALAYMLTGRLVLGDFPWNLSYKTEGWETIVILLLASFLLFIGWETFGQTDNGKDALTGMRIGLPIALAAVFLTPLIIFYAGGADVATGWLHVVMTIGGAVMVGGIMPVVFWWYIVDDGWDREDIFDGMDAGTAPYLLPYVGSWQCGQGFHGFYSHNYDSNGNHCSYDFNNAKFEHALAARAGLVVQLDRDFEDENTSNPNQITVLHFDWRAGHDVGSDLERGVTYAEYLHLAKHHLHVQIGQSVVQGHHIADIDDTGVSALNHLHFSSNGVQNNGNVINKPVLFADGSLRGFRSFASTDGKPMSLAFFNSDNHEDTTPDPLLISLTDAPGPAGHTHTLFIDFADLPADGTLPASFEAFTDAGTPPSGHVHKVTLTSDELTRLRSRDDSVTPTTTQVLGHTHTLSLDARPTARGNLPAYQAVPDAARLLARLPEPYHLLGEQMHLRIDGRVTESYFFGANRPGVTAPLTLDRGPAQTHTVTVAWGNFGGGASTIKNVAPNADTSVREAAGLLTGLLQAAPRVNVIVRGEPSVVLESRRRGSSASLGVTQALPAIGAAVAGATGSGTVPDLANVPRAALRDLIAAALTPAAPPVIGTVLVGGATPSLALTLAVPPAAPAPVDTISGTARVADVLGGLLSAGAVTGADPLPISAGLLDLAAGGTTFRVPLLAAPARAVVSDPTGATLLGAGLTGSPLEILVRDSRQSVVFSGTDTTLDLVAQRIVTQAEGVRAFAAGGSLIVETVAAGHAVTIELQKAGAAANTLPGVVHGESPPLTAGTIRIADSTSVTLAELRAMITDAAAKAALGPAPIAVTVDAAAGQIKLTSTTGTAGDHVSVTGPAPLMAALGVPPASAGDTESTVDAADAVTLAVPASIDLPTGGWLDVAIAGKTWRVPIVAEPARLDLFGHALPKDGDHLGLTVNGAAVDIAFRGGGADDDISSLPRVAGRIGQVAAAAGADRSLIARLGYRLVFENALYGPSDNDLELRASPGLAAAGFLTPPARAVSHGQYTDHAAIGGSDLRRTRRTLGPLRRAFDARLDPPAPAATRVLVTSSDGRPLTIASDAKTPENPFQFAPVGGGAGPATDWEATADGVRLPRPSHIFRVTVTNDETMTVEINAAVAHARTLYTLTAASLPAGAALTVRALLVPAGGGAPNVTAAGVADLTGVTSLADVAGRLERDVPFVRAWVSKQATTPGGASIDALNIETRSGGTGRRLELEGRDVLVALGFDRLRIDGSAAGVLSAAGSGNVRDGNSVALAELGAILETMGGLMTVRELIDPAGAPPTPTHALTITRSPTDLVIASAEGAVTLASDPPSLRDTLNPSEIGNVARLAPAAPATFALDTGWIFISVAGTRVAVAKVHGNRAAVEAADPFPSGAALTTDLAALVGATIDVAVDGGATSSVAFATAPATGDELLARLGSQVPTAWFGLVDRGGALHLRVESRTRGNASHVRITLPHAMLGFAAAATDASDAGQQAGSGNVDNLEAVTLDDLSGIFGSAAQFGGAAQAAVQASVVGNNLQVVALGGPTTVLAQGAPGPGGVSLVAAGTRTDILNGPFGAPLQAATGVLSISVTPGAGGFGRARRLVALLRAQPARLGPMTINALAGLEGKNLTLTVETTAVTVNLAGLATEQDVVVQLEAQSAYRVRAAVRGGALFIESRREGTTSHLALDPGSTALGPGALGSPPLTSVQGTGDAQDLDRVTGAEYKEIINQGFLGDDDTLDAASTTTVNLLVSGTPPAIAAAAAQSHASIKSQRTGCMSSVELLPFEPPATGAARDLARPFLEQLQQGPPPLRLDWSHARGPAIRASVALAAFADNAGNPVDANGLPLTRDLHGSLFIRLNDNGGGADVAPTTDVEVRFDGTFTARQAAERIHATLFSRGVGCAAAFPDGVIVIESLAPGLAGSVEVPAPGAPASDPNVLTTLGLSAPLRARGWPNAGGSVAAPVKRGFRGRAGAARAAAQLSLTDSAGAVLANVPITVGETAQAAADALDAQLRVDATGSQRKGLARRGIEDAVYIESSVATDVKVDGTAPAVVMPEARFRWIGAEAGVDASLELRPTDILRTFRFVHYTRGHGRQLFFPVADFTPAPAPARPVLFDAGWVAAPTDPNASNANLPFWPLGRYLLACRAQGARSDTDGAAGARTIAYAPEAEMIVSGGTATVAGETVHFIRQARYWVKVSRGDFLRVARVGSEFLLDFIVRS